MSLTEEKKFVIKYTFKDVKFSGVQRTYEGDREKHFGVPWRIRIVTEPSYINIFLDCLKFKGNSSWKISTEINGKIAEDRENMQLNNPKQAYPGGNCLKYYSLSVCNKFMSNGNVIIELEVKITGMSGIEFRKLRNFDDDEAREHSDVMLKIGEKKFYIYKSYLSLHSSYFKSLFSGNFEESKKSEIELKDIDPDDMRKFLEVLYGEPAVDEDNVFGILQLADMYDSKTAIRRCEECFLFKSEHSLREKFHAALKYNMRELKKKCLTEMKTVSDYRSILPETSGQFDTDTWEELFLKGLTVEK